MSTGEPTVGDAEPTGAPSGVAALRAAALKLTSLYRGATPRPWAVPWPSTGLLVGPDGALSPSGPVGEMYTSGDARLIATLRELPADVVDYLSAEADAAEAADRPPAIHAIEMARSILGEAFS